MFDSRTRFFFFACPKDAAGAAFKNAAPAPAVGSGQKKSAPAPQHCSQPPLRLFYCTVGGGLALVQFIGGFNRYNKKL